MSDVVTCLTCTVRIKRCNCGAVNGQPHWVDLEYDSRWCAVPNAATGIRETHEPRLKR